MTARSAGLWLASALLLSSCAARGPPPSTFLRGSPYVGALQLPAVGPTPYQPHRLNGQVVLITFFATWCFPCLGELPLLDKLQQELGPRGFQVVAVGMDLEEAKVLEPFAQLYGYSYPIVVGGDPLRSGRTAFGRISTLPTTALLARDGSMRLAFQGLANAKELRGRIDEALDER